MCIYHLDEEGYTTSLDSVSVDLGIESSCSDVIISGEVRGSDIRLGCLLSYAGLTVDLLMILLVELLSILKVIS